MVLAESAESEVLAESADAMVPPSCLRKTGGNTIRHIAAVLHIAIDRRPTASAAPRAVIHSRDGKPARSSGFPDRAEISGATAPEREASEIAAVVRISRAAPAGRARPIEGVAPVWVAEGERIASATAISRAAAAAIETPSEEVPGLTTDRVPATAAAAAPPACDPAADSAVVAEAVPEAAAGAGRSARN